MSKTILIPTDFSKVCDNAINHGAEIAKNIGAKIIIAHIINSDSLLFLKGNSLNPSYVDDQLADIKFQLEKVYQIPVQTVVKKGKILNSIASLSREMQADLILLGTHGKTGIQKITGSHAEKLIQAVDIPVLVVQKRTFGMGYRKIVFPINVSTDYNTKIDWTIFIASTFKAEVLIFTMNTQNKAIEKSMNHLVMNIISKFDAHKIVCHISQAEKNKEFAKQINDFAVSNSADLIMIKVDNDEYEPSFIHGAPEEKMIFNSSQIPVFCAQNKLN